MPLLMYTGDQEEIVFRDVVFPYGEAVEVPDTAFESLYQKLKALPYFVEVNDDTVFEVIDVVAETDQVEPTEAELEAATAPKGKK